jgi:hypothetical protein
MIRRFMALGIERVTFMSAVTLDELKTFAGKFSQLEKTLTGDALKEAAALLESPNIRVGRVTMGRRRPKTPTWRRCGACTPRRCRWPRWCGKARGPGLALSRRRRIR